MRNPLMMLQEKLNPKWTALICIDYQNDYCAQGGALDRCGFNVTPMASIASRIKDLIDKARQIGIPIIFVRNIYSTKEDWYFSDVTFSQTRRTLRGLQHEVRLCEKGSWGWEYFDEVRPQEGDCEVFKHRYNAFVNTDLDLILRSKGIRTLIVCGVTTNVCIESTVRHAYFIDYYCIVPRDCVAAYGEDLHEMALRNIDFLFGEVTESSQIVDVLQRSTK